MDYSKDTKHFWRLQIKKRGVQALGGKCIICGGKFEECCYDFHHLDPTIKDFTISSCNTNGAKSWLKIRDELKKCAVLCSNCHRLLHNGFVEIDTTKCYFIDDYYDWDWCDEIAFNTKTGEPIKSQIKVCPICGNEKAAASKTCRNCSENNQRHFDVSREELKELIYVLPFTEIGRQFGVSDNAIRKRCVLYGLPSKKSDIKQFTREDWDKI